MYRTQRPFSLNIEPGQTIEKGGKDLLVSDYLAYYDDSTMTILIRDGRTISPVAILDAFSGDALSAWEVTKVETLFGK